MQRGAERGEARGTAEDSPQHARMICAMLFGNIAVKNNVMLFSCLATNCKGINAGCNLLLRRRIGGYVIGYATTAGHSAGFHTIIFFYLQ